VNWPVLAIFEDLSQESFDNFKAIPKESIDKKKLETATFGEF
jgi:hypothetical protein